MDFNVSAWVLERYGLSVERLREMAVDCTAPEPYNIYFSQLAAFALDLADIYAQHQDGRWEKWTLTELEDINYRLYKDILPGVAADDDDDDEMMWHMASCMFEGSFDAGYDFSYANPAYAKKMLGPVYGPMLSWLVTELRGLIPLSFEGRLEEMTILHELLIQVYNTFENGLPEEQEVRGILYWYVSDYSDQTVTRKIRERLDPSLSFYRDIIMQSDLNNPSYLYQYGAYISANERKMSAYLAGLSQDVIDDMARTFVSGYVRGFEVGRIDMSVRKNVWLRGSIGFERMLKSVIEQFEKEGLCVLVTGEDIYSINKTAMRVGLIGTSPNPQYDYDHRQDKGLYLDKALCERIIGVTRTAYAQYQDLAAVFAGTAWQDVFGETPFEPVNKEENIKLSEKQAQMMMKIGSQTMTVMDQYVHKSGTSFSIIAWPLPSIGENFDAIMAATKEVNNLDNELFREVQQRMIDAMDNAAYVRVTGMNGNETDLRIALWQLENPKCETVFENCCADVNIPVGEIFTSPVLERTEGTLHVKNVYLNGLNYRNLLLKFEDGWIKEYSCTNYKNPKENKDYLKENLLQNRESLPMGEFAIGTNTTAYAMARRFNIGKLLPILIMEKTGPHFAIGDTCYSHSEDHKVYNFDGKEIVARENSCSKLRDTDMANAYFNVHTDITIPYDELGAITACFADGKTVDILRNGRFCLDGTEVLNKALADIKF